MKTTDYQIKFELDVDGSGGVVIEDLGNIEVIDVVVVPTAEVSGGTIKLINNADEDITNEIACETVGTIGRATTLDLAKNKSIKDEVLKIKTNIAAVRCMVYVEFIRYEG